MNEQEVIPYQSTDLCGHRVLVLAPHPDDETFGCGGALLLHRQHQDAVRVIFITSGEAGDWQGGSAKEAFSARREAEAEKALACLGISDREFWRYPDRGVTADGWLINRLCEAIRTFGATLVYAPSPLEQHPDHRAIAHALRAALRGWQDDLRVGFYEVGYALPPNTLVDISSVWERKATASQMYDSQIHGPNYLAVNHGLGRFRALTLGAHVTAAEAFRILPVHQLEQDVIWQWQALQTPKMSGGEAPAVSVVVRTKDRPTLLREALASLVAQTFHDFEVVVVNDGGKDVSDIIAEYPTLRSTLVQLPINMGRGAATNAGVEAARGTFIAYLDDDDLYYPAHLATLYPILAAQSHLGAVYSDAVFAHYRFDMTLQRFVLVRQSINSSEDFDPEELLFHNTIPNLCLMHRRDAWEQVGKFDAGLNHYEDWDFFLRLARAYRFLHVPQCTAEYRLRDDGTNISLQTPWMGAEEVTARAAMYQRYQEHRTPEVEARVVGKLVSEILVRREQAHENERVRQHAAALEDKLRHFAVQAQAPVVSILIPTKNGERYLDELLSAIAAQQGDGQSLEVIAVDSGSRDRTLAILLRHNVRIVQIPPEEFGHGKTRNLLAQQARGEFLVFLTQDATPANAHWLHNLLAPLRNDPNIVGAYSRHEPRPQCHPMEWHRIVAYELHGKAESRVHAMIDNPDYERNRSLYRFFANTSSVLRRSIWEKFPFPEVDFAEDQAWAEQVLKAGYKTAYAADSLVIHSHSYGPWANFCRHFEHAVAMHKLFGDRPQRTVYNCLTGALRVARLDLSYWRWQGTRSRSDVLLRWGVPAVSWHLAGNIGYWLGENVGRLPNWLVRRLSYQEQVKQR